MKTLAELNREFQLESLAKYRDKITGKSRPLLLEAKNPKVRQQKQIKQKQRGVIAIISNVAFYTAILIILFTVLTYNSKNGTPKMLLGYSYFTVLTSSMQNEIPKGSFILVKETESHKLKVGDNITYMRDANTSVTHQIINIYENYQKSGSRGFQTKGVNNANPDKDIVYEENIVGKVIVTLPGVGAAISYLGANIYIIFIIFGLFVLLSFSLRGLLKKSDNRLSLRRCTLKGWL